MERGVVGGRAGVCGFERGGVRDDSAPVPIRVTECTYRIEQLARIARTPVLSR
jgi:hypothetical protein